MKTIVRALGLALGLICGQALAQTYTVGVLEYGTRAGFEPLLAAFKEGMAENGFVEGRNLRLARISHSPSLFGSDSADWRWRAISSDMRS